MKIKAFYLLFFILLGGCISEEGVTITVKNNSSKIRKNASVTILLSELISKQEQKYSSISFKDIKTDKTYTSQLVDENGDGEKESVLFQPTLKANSTNEYEVVFLNEKANLKNNDITTYSRFVPERIDDYAWENDRVAFRTFGPKAQLLFEEDRMEGKDKGTISSG
ncbi:MAG: DUF4861 domain-containing protein, partial [Lutibacter sp.]|uniref:DUF4861 family protein n=1 Tax=Lutibacter sp. TaxID=1925666 RepID=UPI0019FFA86A